MNIISRLSLILSSKSSLMLVCAAFVLGGTGIIASKAAFNYKTVNPASTFTAGSIHHINSKGGSSVFATNPLMIPGDTLTGSVVITNDGNLPGFFKADVSNIVDTPGVNGGNLSSVLTLLIKDGATTVYSGSLAGLTSVTLDGDLATPGIQAMPASGANSAHTYDITLTFPNGGVPASNTTGDNLYRSSTTTFNLNWTQNDR